MKTASLVVDGYVKAERNSLGYREHPGLRRRTNDGSVEPARPSLIAYPL